jgi:hypothetical protein
MNIDPIASNLSLKRRLQHSGSIPVFSKVFPGGALLSQSPKLDSSYNPMSVQYNQYQPSSARTLRSYQLGFILISLSLLLFVGLNVWFLDFKPPKYYCTDKHLKGEYQESGCIPCPADSTCLNGAIVECHREKILIQRECVEDTPEAILEKQMRVQLVEYLAEQKGDAQCSYSNENSDAIKLSQIDEILKAQFGVSTVFPIAMAKLKEKLKNGPNDFPEHIRVSAGASLFHDSHIQLTSDSTKRPVLCRLITVLEQHPWPLFFLIVGVIYYVLRLQHASEEADNIKRAENLYKCLLAMIRVERKIRANDLFEFLPESLGLERRERVLKWVQEILIADKQLSLRFENNEDYYVAH